MATTIDDNAADEKSDKSIWRLLNIRCTSVSGTKKNRMYQDRAYLITDSEKRRDRSLYMEEMKE